MAAAKMPLMMENPMPVNLQDVDDLFGDSVGLSLPIRSQSKYLHQRMEELRSRGCCQAVAWSRTGTIASITADGLNVELRNLQRSPKDGTWDLSDATICTLVKGTPSIPLVHLAWAATSIPDLAVIDAIGRVTIMSFSICLDHPYLQRKWDGDSIDDMRAVMGAYWLNIAPTSQQPYNVTYGAATRHGNGYNYESSFVHPGGPTHPNPGKSALMIATSNGTLKMIWSQNTNRVEETTIELESVNSAEDQVTHASFASEKRHLLVVLATSSKQLKLARVEIQWGLPAQAEKVTHQQARVLNPSIQERHLATTNWAQGGTMDTSQDANMSELTHLELLPPLPDNTGGKVSAPTVVVAIKSRASLEGPYQMAQSVLDRWELVEQKEKMYPAFEQLGNRRNSISSEVPNSLQLRKLPSIVLNKLVIGFHTMHFGKVLILSFADGSVEYRDRFTFEELYTTEDTTKVISLRQVGWNFADQGPCQQVAFSPSYCSMIQLSDGKLRWNRMEYTLGDIGNSMQEPHYAASIAALTVNAAPSICYQGNYDDLLALARPYTPKKRFTQDFLTEIIRILKIQVDYSEDTHHDSLVRNGSLQSCLSIMNALGYQGDLNSRVFSGKFSMLSLNVRNVVVLITIASNTPLTIKEKLSPLDEPEVVETLAGCARWSLDLIAWLMDSLFELMGDDTFMELLAPQRFNEIAAYLHHKNNIALHFMMSSSSRGFLSAICRRLGHLEALSGRAIDFYRRTSADPSHTGKPVPRLQQAYHRMQQVTSSGLIKVAEFEKLLTGFGNDIRQSYALFLPQMIKAQPNSPQGKQIDVAVKQTRIQFELALLLSASPPPIFVQLLLKFFNKDLRAFRSLTDPAKLFYADYTLLEIQDDKRSLELKRARGPVHIDVFKRTQIQASATQQLRRCTRCAALMEDVFGSRPGYTFVLGQQRKCACGGHWALLPLAKPVPRLGVAKVEG